MKVDIWSDVMCPFCYIGKRRFEQALQDFDQQQQVEVVWHSFELHPELGPAYAGKSINQYLAQRKVKGGPWNMLLRPTAR